jgi:hypothetical protein
MGSKQKPESLLVRLITHKAWRDLEDRSLWFFEIIVTYPIPETKGRDILFMFAVQSLHERDVLWSWLKPILEMLVDKSKIEVSEVATEY